MASVACCGRWATGLGLVFGLAGCAAPAPGTGQFSPGLRQAAANYPAMILGGNVRATDGERPRPCAGPGAVVVQKGGEAMAFGGADPSDPALCVLSVGGQTARAWYDIWLTDWPGAAEARPLLRQVLEGPSGTVAGFDNLVTPERHYHDLVRNEGVEDIFLLGKTYHALKISHYREGYDGNGYRSVSTVWKDVPSGMLIYGTYQHIAGAPEVDDPILPVSISGG